MTEPTRKKKKDRYEVGLHLVPSDGPHSSGSDPLRWWTSHAQRPGEINLHDFADGIPADTVRSGLRSGFSARPELIMQLAPYIKLSTANAPSTTVHNIRPALRTWWRIFDECEDIAPVRSLEDLNEIHNAAFLRMGANLHSQYNKGMKFIRIARHELGLPPLYWTTPERRSSNKNLINPRAVRLIYHYLKRRCFEILQRFAEYPDVPPAFNDVKHLLVLFLLRTGWNLQTALDIDVSLDNDGTLSCLSRHPTSRDHHVVASRKARSQGREQFALGTDKSMLSCGNIIQALVRQSGVLRRSLTAEYETLSVGLQQKVSSPQYELHVVKMKDLKAKLRSPWLYAASSDPSAEIRVLRSTFATSTGTTYMASVTDAINMALRPGEKPISRIAISDLRDAYIEAQYARSGYSWLTAMLAAQHSSVDSIATYLRKRQYKAHSESRFLSVTEKVWAAAVLRKPIDPMLIAGEIEGATPSQILRWQAGKDRTRVGMACRDFYRPPKSISPTHILGTGCRVQRCTLCSHGIVFTDSIIHIARRVEELNYIRSTIPLLSWVQSTFPAELETAQQIIDTSFGKDEGSLWRQHWRAQISSGQHLPLSIEGSYE